MKHVMVCLYRERKSCRWPKPSVTMNYNYMLSPLHAAYMHCTMVCSLGLQWSKQCAWNQ